MTDILDLIGGTPLVELKACTPKAGVHLFAKLEGQNPTGSVKDRIVAYMVARARADGRLKPGQEIVEASTGNTGIALSMVGHRLGHPIRVVVPETVFADVAQALQVWEPQIEWVAADLGIKSAISVAQDIARRDGSFLLDQFGSNDNPRCHYETTAVELLAQQPRIDVFVCGIGTGGTAMGVGKRLKEHNPSLQLVAANRSRAITCRVFAALMMATSHLSSTSGGLMPRSLSELPAPFEPPENCCVARAFLPDYPREPFSMPH